MKLILRELTTDDEQAFREGLKDWVGEDPEWYSFVWTKEMTHSEHLQVLKDQKDKNKIPSHRVPSTMLYGFVTVAEHGKSKEVIVGRLSIRHELNDFLFQRGGHVGYAVSPKHRQKGYATEILRQGLQCCKDLGLTKILITCSDSNVASQKIIEKLGGCLENKLFDEEKNEFLRRYWLEL